MPEQFEMAHTSVKHQCLWAVRAIQIDCFICQSYISLAGHWWWLGGVCLRNEKRERQGHGVRDTEKKWRKEDFNYNETEMMKGSKVRNDHRVKF